MLRHSVSDGYRRVLAAAATVVGGSGVTPGLEGVFMADINVTVRDNGPLLIRGGVTVVDASGKPYETKEVVALCRCGHSGNKPFCDGAHQANAFESAPRAEQ